MSEEVEKETPLEEVAASEQQSDDGAEEITDIQEGKLDSPIPMCQVRVLLELRDTIPISNLELRSRFENSPSANFMVS